MGGCGRRSGPPTPSPCLLQKSAEAIEKKGLDFLRSAKKCKIVQKSAQAYEKAAVGFLIWETAKHLERLHPRVQGTCRNLKEELREGQFVSA
jgi:hypothetical protein